MNDSNYLTDNKSLTALRRAKLETERSKMGAFTPPPPASRDLWVRELAVFVTSLGPFREHPRPEAPIPATQTDIDVCHQFPKNPFCPAVFPATPPLHVVPRLGLTRTLLIPYGLTRPPAGRSQGSKVVWCGSESIIMGGTGCFREAEECYQNLVQRRERFIVQIQQTRNNSRWDVTCFSRPGSILLANYLVSSSVLRYG